MRTRWKRLVFFLYLGKKKMSEEIKLSPQELEELKDTIKFRECVILKLKQLNNVPKKVTILETKMLVYAWLIGVMVAGMLGLAFSVLAK